MKLWDASPPSKTGEWARSKARSAEHARRIKEIEKQAEGFDAVIVEVPSVKECPNCTQWMSWSQDTCAFCGTCAIMS